MRTDTKAAPSLPLDLGGKILTVLEVDVLRPSRSGAVCITCQHFRYAGCCLFCMSVAWCVSIVATIVFVVRGDGSILAA